MPIDPYAALNAMLRAEVSRFSPPVRQERQAERPVPHSATAEAESGTEPQQDPAGSAA
ncbi:hypothetical protein [Streptomyces sp. NBC_00091]|uniref:hypothetical protein n=1 Tax=Streptomyces sp. NBC_00091 TaxID=2975648 RepID=UPI002254305F|nr:hypothetical protein [Streptomyces sp. NBC_00091]MCX5377339.1 hypothetical protein [Streptomyces sp. NBC_00091]